MSKIRTELFQKPNQTFNDHLNIDENYRILFSGRFGIGKTTFLNHYFKENNDKYNIIHLFPVNYSVLENEDIFKYIKYDILVDLLTLGDKPTTPDYKDLFKDVPSFVLDNFLSIFGTLVLLSSKLGRPINQFIKELHDWKKKYKEYSASENEIEENEISAFLKDIHFKESGLYESGYITNIIINWLRSIKNPQKENVLVIDDLDRIDPHHIFRLLNVFSAHFDNKDRDESKNKFGFDKIILVCDIDNIRNIYESQFGIKTDFNGYVDKFYSKEVYRFDNRENIDGILDILTLSLDVGEKAKDTFLRYPRDRTFRAYLLLFLQVLVEHNKINLRSLLKYSNRQIDVLHKKIAYAGKEFNVKEYQLLISFHVLSLLMGKVGNYGEGHVFSSISRIVFHGKSDKLIGHLISRLLVFSDPINIRLDRNKQIAYAKGLSYIDNLGTTFIYNLTNDNREIALEAEITAIRVGVGANMRDMRQTPSFYISYDFAHLISKCLENLSE